MAMLDRYRKPGGFVQLLALIETCAPAKQEKLLEIIAQEDPRWADTVREKMLSIQRIYSWNDQALAEIFGTLQDLTVAVALHVAEPALKARVTGFFTHGRLRKIEDLVGANGPSAGEVASTHMRIVESVRKMGMDGFLRFENVDPALVISDAIEEALSHPLAPGEVLRMNAAKKTTGVSAAVTNQPGQQKVLHAYSPLADHMAARGEMLETSSAMAYAPVANASSPAGTSEAGESRLMELQALKKRVAELSKENAIIRHELSLAKSKLDQIKKLA